MNECDKLKRHVIGFVGFILLIFAAFTTEIWSDMQGIHIVIMSIVGTVAVFYGLNTNFGDD